MESTIEILGADSGLGGSMSPPPTPSQTRVKQRTFRSCEVCHQRKIRCDKKSPCSNCARGKALCRYPGPERKARRPHKTTITDVAARLSQLEGVIRSATSNSDSAQNVSQLPEASAEIPWRGRSDMSQDGDTGTNRHASAEDLLIEDGGTSCYVNEVLLSRILDEERELQSAVGTPKNDQTEGIDPGRFHFELLSDFKKPSIDDPSQHPSRRNAINLWRTFTTRVDPMCKILHLPTMEISIFEAINDSTNLEPDLNALLFSIYFIATTSLSPSELFNLTGLHKYDALLGFKKGLEQSLATANFLDTATLRSLQAVTLYLFSLRTFDLGRSTWSIYGLLMRSAQSIGLHRDGSTLGLSIFKTEMRRRLWWFMCVSDSRAAEDHGISVSSSASDLATTKLPSNVDDSDLAPEMIKWPEPKQKWTPMIFLLILIENTILLPRKYLALHNASSADFDASSGSDVLRDFMTHLENTYLRFCNRLIPAQLNTWLMARYLALKVSFVGQQTLERRGAIGNEGSDTAEEFLATACEILELSCQIQVEDLLQDFHWIQATYTPYHVLTYVLWHLCVKPVGMNAERAYSAVEQVFELLKERKFSMERDVRWATVKVLRRKTYQRMRESANPQNLIDMGGRFMESSQIFSGNSDSSADMSIQDPTLWDITATNFADWSNLVDNCNMYGFDS